MNDAVRTIRSLQIPDVKVYETVGNQVTVLTKGTLEVLYSAEFDRFVLRVNSFYYVLSVYLPVMASLFEARAFRAYTLPSLNGFYILKFKTEPAPFVVQNFETILSNYSRFSFKSQDAKLMEEQRLAEQSSLKQAGYTGKENVVVNQVGYQKPDNLGKAGDYLKKGGDFLKNNLLKAANYIGKSIDSQQTTNQAGFTPKTIGELKGLHSNAQFVDFPGSGMAKLIEISNQIQQRQSAPNMYSNQVLPTTSVDPIHQQTTWAGFKDTTTNSAKSLWSGMGEAVNIVSNAVSNRRNTNRKANVPQHQNAPVIVDKTQVVQNPNLMPGMQVTESVRIHKEVDPYSNKPIRETVLQEVTTNDNHGNIRKIENYHTDGQNNLYPSLGPVPGYQPYAQTYATNYGPK